MKAVYALILVIVFSACSKSPKAPSGDELTGTWNWVAQHRGAPQYTQTPMNTGIQEQLHFGGDNRWELVQNNVMIQSGSYHLTYSKNDRGEKVKTMHRQEDNDNSITTEYYVIKSDTLSFDSGPMGIIGGGVRVYAR